MDLSPYIESLQQDLAKAVSAGDDDTKRSAAVLSAALEPAARLTLMHALADFAAEVTASLDNHVVGVNLEGQGVRVTVTETGSAESRDDTPPPPPPNEETGDMSRMTLRLFEQLKSKAEQAAAAQGVSLNTFVQQAVQGALRPHTRRHGPKGWGRPPWAGMDANDAGDTGYPDEGTGRSSRVHGWYEG